MCHIYAFANRVAITPGITQNRRMFDWIVESPWRMLGIAGWCFLMAWGFRIGLLRMALSLASIGLLVMVAWAFRDAKSPALVYGPLVFIGVICVISIGYFGRHLETKLGYGSKTVRINHAGGLLLGLLIGGLIWAIWL